MPATSTETVSTAPPRIAAILQGTALLLVIWGALAFGAVYQWAYVPLATAAAATGAVALWRIPAARPLDRPTRLVLWLLGGIAVVGLLQLLPVSEGVRRAISPATEAYLRTHDPAYGGAIALRSSGAPLADAFAVPMRPLSLNPAATWRGLMLLAGFGLLLAGLLRLFAATGVRRLAAQLLVFGVVLALIGIVQKAVLGDHAFGGMKIYGVWQPRFLLTTPFGPYINKNHYAGWMLMALPLALGWLVALMEQGSREAGPGFRRRLLWLSSPAGGRLQLTLIAAGLMALALVMTLSRSGLACLALIALVTAVLAVKRLASRTAALAVLVTMLGTGAAAVLVSGVDLRSRMGVRDASVQLRIDAWTDAAAIIRDFPVLGTGLNTYEAATRKYRTAGTTFRFFEAHNDYIQVLAEGGVVTFGLLLTAMIACVAAVRRRFQEHRDDPASAWIRRGAAVGLVAIATQSLVEFSLQMPGNAVLCVVLLAIALHAPEHEAARAVASSSSRRSY